MSDKPKDRRTYMGSGDLPAILGVARKTALQVWGEKTGRVQPQQSNEAMERGKETELSTIAGYERRTKRTTTWPIPTIEHPSKPYLAATPDALSVDDDLRDLRIVEAKLVGFRAASQWGPADARVIPMHVQIQVMYQRAIAQLSTVELAPVVDVVASIGTELPILSMACVRDHELALLEYAEWWWWRYVVGDRAPPPQSPADLSVVKEIYPRVTESLAPATGDQTELLRHYAAAKRQEREAAEKKAMLEAEVLAEIAGRAGISAGDLEVRWSEVGGKTVTTNWEAVAKELGATQELIAKHSKQRKGYRKLTLKGEMTDGDGEIND